MKCKNCGWTLAEITSSGSVYFLNEDDKVWVTAESCCINPELENE